MSVHSGGFRDSISRMDGNGNGMRIVKVAAAVDRKCQNRAPMMTMEKTMTPMVELVFNLWSRFTHT